MGTRKLTPEEIHYDDAGVFTLGDDQLRALVSRALSRIPADVVEDLMDNCLMVMPLEAEKGTYLSKELLEGKGLIAFPEALLSWEYDEAEFTILHEVAHYVLNHQEPILTDMNIEEYDAQEAEANALVKQWLESE